MKSALMSDSAKSAKSLAQDIAKRMAKLPGEVIDEAREQITGEELSGEVRPPGQPQEKSDEQKKQIEARIKENDQIKSGRRLEALNNEINDIRKQDMFSDLQGKISRGEKVSLEEYPELSLEQKQVLLAQMEAVKNQMDQQIAQESQNGIPNASSRPSRRMGAGQKQEAEKQTTRVEKPVPPSG